MLRKPYKRLVDFCQLLNCNRLRCVAFMAVHLGREIYLERGISMLPILIKIGTAVGSAFTAKNVLAVGTSIIAAKLIADKQSQKTVIPDNDVDDDELDEVIERVRRRRRNRIKAKT